MYTKDPYVAKYQFLINKHEDVGTKHLNDSKAFIEDSNDMDYIYESIEKYNANTKHKISIFFDDMIADMLSNKKLNPVVTELFIKGKKTNHFSRFYYTILFSCAKKILD